MLEPSDLNTAVNRLLVGFGLVMSSTAYLLAVAFIGAGSGRAIACYLAIAALGFCSMGYIAQLSAAHRRVAIWLVGMSWILGILAGLALLAR